MTIPTNKLAVIIVVSSSITEVIGVYDNKEKLEKSFKEYINNYCVGCNITKELLNDFDYDSPDDFADYILHELSAFGETFNDFNDDVKWILEYRTLNDEEEMKHTAEETLNLMKKAIDSANEKLEENGSLNYSEDDLLEELCYYVEDYFKGNIII